MLIDNETLRRVTRAILEAGGSETGADLNAAVGRT